jgi:CheY-like chemotaxis protein
VTAARCRGVLIVDDDVDLRETIEEVLSDHDVPAIGAENGAVALDRLRSEAEPPCVILLTAHPSGERAARELGVDGYLPKPVDLKILLDVIARYCEP